MYGRSEVAFIVHAPRHLSKPIALNDVARALSSGQLVYLAGASKHSLRALKDSSLLLTILLMP
jgi:hypothetical protein